MDSAAYIASITGLQRERDSMPPAVADLFCTMFDLVDLQNDAIRTLLKMLEAERLKD